MEQLLKNESIIEDRKIPEYFNFETNLKDAVSFLKDRCGFDNLSNFEYMRLSSIARTVSATDILDYKETGKAHGGGSESACQFLIREIGVRFEDIHMDYLARNLDTGEIFSFDTITLAEAKAEEMITQGLRASAMPSFEPTEEFKKYIQILRKSKSE